MKASHPTILVIEDKATDQAGMTHLMLILHAYWMTCEAPQIDVSGRQVRRSDKGKLSARFTPKANAADKIHRTGSHEK